jgi:uncharacterized protein
MIRVVLDTSVLVSAVISVSGPNSQVFDLITSGTIRPCVSEALLTEYHAVFEYERLQHLDRRRIAKLRGLLEAIAVRAKPRRRLQISEHEDDNRVYECAQRAKAEYIITENTKHFKQGHGRTKIVTARQFIRLIAKSTKLKAGRAYSFGSVLSSTPQSACAVPSRGGPTIS